MNKTVSLVSLVCAKNLVDSEFLIGGLKQEKYNIVSEPEDSDIVIVNTCGFLDTAREEGIDTILKAAQLKTDNKRKRDQGLEISFKLAKVEAGASFSDENVYIEKYLKDPRHIEIQILCDAFGNIIPLG